MDEHQDEESTELSALDEKRWQRLCTEVRVFRGEGTHNEAYAEVMSLAMEGDKGLLQWIALSLQEKILDGEKITPPDNFLICWILEQIAIDEDLARRVSGARKAGRSKDGGWGLSVAVRVIGAAENAQRMEDAWAEIASATELSEDMVKRHWSRWKDVALRLCQMTPEDLANRMKLNRGS